MKISKEFSLMAKRLFIIFSAIYASLLGQTAPNLVATDLNGVAHNVYEYLDEGKLVLLDFFILNCIPCQDGAEYMSEFWESYGPNGSDQIQILSVEVNNNSDEIVEETSNNWGIINPVINSNDIPGAYIPFVYAFPNYIMICPDRSMSLLAHGFGYPISLLEWEQALNTCNFGNDYTDVTIFDLEITHCKKQVFANINIGNVGLKPASNISIDVFTDSSYHSTINWNYVLPTGSVTNDTSQPISFENSDINGSTIHFQINANGDVNQLNNTVSYDLTNELITTNKDITIEIKTDNYPDETTWSLVDGNGNIVSEGAGVNYQSNELISIDLELDSSMCYTFMINDKYGDGICCSYGDGYYQITAGEDTLVYNNKFLTHKKHSFYVDEVIDIEETNQQELRVINSKFFDLKGREISYPQHAGAYLRKDYYENGFTKSSKIIICERK